MQPDLADKYQAPLAAGLYWDSALLSQTGELRVNTTTVSEQTRVSVGMSPSGNFQARNRGRCRVDQSSDHHGSR